MEHKNPTKRRSRIHAKLRLAIQYHIRHVMTARQACEAAGISLETWEAAVERPHVQSFMNQERTALLAGHDEMAKLQPAQARRVLSDILGNDQVSPAIRVRAAGKVMRDRSRKNLSGSLAINIPSRDSWKTDQNPKIRARRYGRNRPKAALNLAPSFCR